MTGFLRPESGALWVSDTPLSTLGCTWGCPQAKWGDTEETYRGPTFPVTHRTMGATFLCCFELETIFSEGFRCLHLGWGYHRGPITASPLGRGWQRREMKRGSPPAPPAWQRGALSCPEAEGFSPNVWPWPPPALCRDGRGPPWGSSQGARGRHQQPHHWASSSSGSDCRRPELSVPWWPRGGRAAVRNLPLGEAGLPGPGPGPGPQWLIIYTLHASFGLPNTLLQVNPSSVCAFISFLVSNYIHFLLFFSTSIKKRWSTLLVFPRNQILGSFHIFYKLSIFYLNHPRRYL